MWSFYIGTVPPTYSMCNVALSSPEICTLNLEAMYISEVFTFPSQTAQFHNIDNYGVKTEGGERRKGFV